MKNLLFLIIVLLFTAFGCEDDNQNYPALNNEDIPIEYAIKVISTSGGFYGYYFCDDGPVSEFRGDMDSFTSIAVYESEICQDPKSGIKVYARTENGTATSLDVYIFKNQILVNWDSGTREFDDSSQPFSVNSHYLIWDEEMKYKY